GEYVGGVAAFHELRQDLRCVPDEADGQSSSGRHRFAEPFHRLAYAVRLAIAVAGLETLIDARFVDLDAQEGRVMQRCRQRLRPAHATQPGCEHRASRERAPEVLARDRTERLEGAL